MAPGGAPGGRRAAGTGLPAPDYTANAAKYMDLYGAKHRAEAKYAEALERAEQARRNVAVVLEKASPATLAAAARKSAVAGIADSRRDDPAKTIR